MLSLLCCKLDLVIYKTLSDHCWSISHVVSILLSFILDRRVEAGKAHMIVTYRGLEMHNDEYDLCEEAADLGKPLYCPFKEGKLAKGPFII